MWGKTKKRKWRTQHHSALKQGERERKSKQASKRDDYIDCLLHPPSALCFFLFFFLTLAASSSSIILPRSIASRHKTELTSAALCNTAPPALRKSCAPLEQLQSSCTNRKPPLRQASQGLVFNPVVKDSKPHNTQRLQRKCYRGESNMYLKLRKKGLMSSSRVLKILKR